MVDWCYEKIQLDNRYGEQLKLARNEGFKKGFFSSLVVGGLYLVIFCTYALGFWSV